jgi:imidazoleglycerol-phosphate dehydratase
MRQAIISRTTNETEIHCELELDGSGIRTIDTGIGFFDHMLDLAACHGCLDLVMEADGDLDVDDHHTIEDCGIVLGDAVKEALGNKAGIARYASVTLPMDESLVTVTMDISGRPYLVFNCEFTRDSIGMMATEMVEEFLRAFAFHAGITLHVNLHYGKNDHHKAEAVFKALGRALRQAAALTGSGIPSSKGMLE